MAQTAPPATPPSTTSPTTTAGHAGVDKIDNRLENQQDRIQAGEKDGQLSAKQAASDTTRDNNVAARECRRGQAQRPSHQEGKAQPQSLPEP